MKKTVLSVLWIGLALGVAVAYNNCGEVTFDSTKVGGTSDNSTAPTNGGGGTNTANPTPTPVEVGTVPTVTNEEVLANNPEIVNTPIVPVTEIPNLTPEQLNTYRLCGNGDIMICHFPDNIDSRHPLCVGDSAVRTHYDHIRSFSTTDGNTVEYFDYLGPCRPL